MELILYQMFVFIIILYVQWSIGFGISSFLWVENQTRKKPPTIYRVFLAVILITLAPLFWSLVQAAKSLNDVKL